jgi:hypothetical protein
VDLTVDQRRMVLVRAESGLLSNIRWLFAS